MTKNSHCSYCGAAYVPEQQWPRKCARCGNVNYVNPLPVAVLLLPVGGGLLPVGGGLLLVRRLNSPQAGGLCLPGGFIELGETWQQAAVRELREEAGLEVEASAVSLFDVQSAPDGTVLIFGLVPGMAEDALGGFKATGETSEIVVIRGPQELAFSTHTAAAARFFAGRASQAGKR